MFLRYQRIKLTCSLLLHYYRCLLLHLTSSLWKIDHLAVVAFRCSYSSEHSTELVRRGRGATSKLLGNSKLGNVQGLGSGPDKKKRHRCCQLQREMCGGVCSHQGQPSVP